MVMKCPDGCGETLTINLDARSGKAWRAQIRRNKLTVYPSVWRQEGCKAHFIIWRDTLIWCDFGVDAPKIEDASIELVRRHLVSRRGEFIHYEEIAEKLGLDPWEALWACQILRQQGQADVRERTLFRII
jgi:hypothetical protein